MLYFSETGVSLFFCLRSWSLRHHTVFCYTLQSIFSFKFRKYKKALQISKHLDFMPILSPERDS